MPGPRLDPIALTDEERRQQVTDQEFLHLAISARESLRPSAAHDPALATAVRALYALLSTAKDAPLPAGPYGNLRLALAGLEEFRKRRHPANPCQGDSPPCMP